MTKAIISITILTLLLNNVQTAKYGQCYLGQCFPKSSNIQDGDQFDFIIVGAGTAGCILANRLTELQDKTVLLIEAGDDPPMATVIPGMALTMPLTKYDWNYTTENDNYSSQSLQNGRMLLTRGKMLGGCGSLAFMVHLRGHYHDYEEWYENGCEGWDPESVLPYFRKLEHVTNPDILNLPESPKYRGTEGPIVLETFQNDPKLTNLYLEGYKKLGFKETPDFNGVQQMGYGQLDTTVFDGIRQSAALKYLNPIVERTNLFVLKNTLVTKVIIDKETKTATGVETVDENGKNQVIFANKEVILSAGAINTPQVLMLSGIGPCDELEQFDIECIADLQVGKNFQDNINVPVIISYEAKLRENTVNDDLQSYLYNRSGRLAHIPATSLTLFDTVTQNSYPDYQNLVLHVAQNSSVLRVYCNLVGYGDKVCNQFIEKNKDREVSVFLVILLKPKSRGEVVLASADPTEYPRIFTGAFAEDEDLDMFANAMIKSLRILETEPFQNAGARLERINIAACDEIEYNTFDYWKCYGLNLVVTTWHPVGTVKMGSVDDDTTVVDSGLRVKGVKNLMAIDASIMPTVASSNINNVVQMIAEKGADLVKQHNSGTSNILSALLGFIIDFINSNIVLNF